MEINYTLSATVNPTKNLWGVTFRLARTVRHQVFGNCVDMAARYQFMVLHDYNTGLPKVCNYTMRKGGIY